MRLEDGLAGRASEDDPRRAQAPQTLAKAGKGLGEDASLAGPVGRSTAAEEDEPGTRLEPLQQIGIGAFHLGGVRGRELAAREEHGIAPVRTGGVARQRGPLVHGEPEILHGEVEGGGRHPALPHHLPP